MTGAAGSGRDRRRRLWLEQQGRPCVLAGATNAPRWALTARGPPQVAAADLAAARPAGRGARRAAGAGSKGPRRGDWARVRLARRPPSGGAHGLRLRRSRADPAALADDGGFAPAGTTLATLVRVAGTRWALEERLAVAQGAVGRADDAVRRWDGWSRHVTLARLAQAYRTVVRARAAAGDKGGAPPGWRPRSSR